MIDEVLGIRRADGSLPDAVLRANLVASNAASIAGEAIRHGKLVGFECPVSRAKGSQFAMEGREDHADMFTHPALASLERDHGMARLFFDQGAFGGDYEKTTQIVATKQLYEALRPHFIHRVARGNEEFSHISGDVGADGTFASEDASAYPSAMNEAIAVSWMEACSSLPSRTAAGSWPAPWVTTNPMDEWGAWLRDTPLVSMAMELPEGAYHAAVHPHPHMHARAASSAAPDAWCQDVESLSPPTPG